MLHNLDEHHDHQVKAAAFLEPHMKVSAAHTHIQMRRLSKDCDAASPLPDELGNGAALVKPQVMCSHCRGVVEALQFNRSFDALGM